MISFLFGVKGYFLTMFLITSINVWTIYPNPTPDKNIIIAGGVNVFKAFWDHIDDWRVTIVKEFVVYDEDIDLTSIQYHWNDRRLLGEGVDNNQNFEIWHYRKKV